MLIIDPVLEIYLNLGSCFPPNLLPCQLEALFSSDNAS